MSVEIPARAQADIDFTAEDLENDYSVRVADRFLDRLHKLLSRLDSQPESAEVVDPPYPAYPGMRRTQVPQFPYQLVYYVQTPTGIRVVRVLHSSRDADAIFS